MALLAVAHNTGTAYLKCGSGSVHPGSLWKNANAVYDYCAKLGSQESYVVLESYITKWYDTVILSEDFDEKFVMAGSYFSGSYNGILEELGINPADYANGWGHKQYYPLKAVLNYMALQKLYYSGVEVG